MNLVYGISRWTNPNRASARHIDDSFGKPLCGDKRKCTWETEQGEPTCKKCIAKYKNVQQVITLVYTAFPIELSRKGRIDIHESSGVAHESEEMSKLSKELGF